MSGMHVDVIMVDLTILLAIISPHIKILWAHIKIPYRCVECYLHQIATFQKEGRWQGVWLI